MNLKEMSDFKRIRSASLMGDSPPGYMATDKLAMAILRKMKEQLGD
jgi:proteasome assembly chaperone (PAC2) family protein